MNDNKHYKIKYNKIKERKQVTDKEKLEKIYIKMLNEASLKNKRQERTDLMLKKIDSFISRMEIEKEKKVKDDINNIFGIVIKKILSV